MAGPRFSLKRSTRTPSQRPQDPPTPTPGPLDDLLDALEFVCLDTMRGDPPSALLAQRLQRSCHELLRQRGIEARVQVSSSHRGTHVTLWLPQTAGAVQKVVLTVG